MLDALKMAEHLKLTRRTLHFTMLSPAAWAGVRSRLNREGATWGTLPYFDAAGAVLGYCVFADAPLGFDDEQTAAADEALVMIYRVAWLVLAQHAAADGCPDWCED